MTDPRRIIFLCGEAEGDAFRTHAADLAPDLETQWVGTAAALELATLQGHSRTRLISFLTDVIVPQSILDRLSLTPYNIHPGSPEYPGAHGLSFAIFDEAFDFGVTAHALTREVDAGPIVLVDRFSLPIDAEIESFSNEVYARAIGVLDMVLRHCIATDEPIPPRPGESWTGKQCTKKRLRELIAKRDYLLPADNERLQRACGPYLEEYQRRHG